MSTLSTVALGLGRRPALLVIDASLGFTEPSSPLACPAEPALTHIEALLVMARQREWPIFFTTNAYSNAFEAPVFREKLPVLNELHADGHWAALNPRLARRPGETLLRKCVPSAFFDSPLRGLLTAGGVDSVVICGFSTSGCVRATAVDALQSNFRVTVLEDACGDRDAQAHAYNLRDIALKTGDVCSTSEFLQALR